MSAPSQSVQQSSLAASYFIGDVVRLPSGRSGRVEGRWGAALCVAYLDAPDEALRILPQHVRPAPAASMRKRK